MFHIFLKDLFYNSVLIGSSPADIVSIGIYLLRYKITPLWIDSEISLPFTNSLWIFKIRCSFTLVNSAVCQYGPVPCRYNFSSCLLFRLLLLLRFLRPQRTLPPPNIPLPPPRPPLPEILIFSLLTDRFRSELSETLLS